MDPAIVNALAGTSGLIGLLALLAYFFYSYQVRKLEQSVRRTIEGEAAGLFNAEKVVEILRTFETPESRLEALKQLIGVDDRAARRVYARIQGSVNLEELTDQDSKKRARASLLIGSFFLIIALIGLAYSAIAPKPIAPIWPTPTPSFSPTPTSSTPPLPTSSAMLSPPFAPVADEVKIGDEIFLHNRDGNYVIATYISPTDTNWARLEKRGKVPLKLLGNGQIRDGSLVRIQSLEQKLNQKNVLFADSSACYYEKDSDDERQEWKIIKLDAPDRVLRYGERIYLENFYYKNKRLSQNSGPNEISLTIEEGVPRWWILEKK